MQIARISEISKYKDQEVTIQGWLYNKRSSGKLRFLQIRDGSNIIQAVIFKGDVSDLIFQKSDELTQESSVIVTGIVKEDKRSPLGFELQVRDIQILQIAPEYPIALKEHGPAFLMDHRHLWLRSSKQHAILKVRHALIRASRDFFDSQGFTLVDAPIFTPAACEGTTTLFETDYFGEK
ncbi:asparagine--tRNA ligase, partial [bacterium]|nr:asparagine--tRNA ligase [candidate division CSSED10-310 bacterium]